MDARVVIAMPSNRELPAETADSFAGIYGRGLVGGYVTAKMILGDTYIDTARNLLVTHAMDVPTRPTHIFWMDDDQVVPSDTIERLLALDVPIAGGLYHQRVAPFMPVAYNFVQTRSVKMIRLPEQSVGPVEVDGLGLGCTLVRIDVYPAMADHYGDAWWHQVSSGRGEDIHFFDRWRQMKGKRPVLDTSVRCGHVRREVVETVHYESYRRAHPGYEGEQDEAEASAAAG